MAVLNSSLVLSLVDHVTNSARGINATVNKLQSSIATNNRRVGEMQGQFLGAAATGWALYRGLSAPLGAAIEFESSMADIAKVTDFSSEGLSAYGRELRDLAANKIPMAVSELADLSAEAAAAGIAQEDLLGFTEMTAKAAVAWGVTGGQAGENLAKLQTALGLTIEQTQLYADAINHLSDNMASDAPGLVDFSRRVASQGEFYGFAKEETLAFGSALISTGAESEVAATSFRNMGRALTKGGSATKAQRNAWKRLGMDSVKVSKAMQEDAVGTTIAVIEALGKLPAHMQASAMSDLFGDEARALAPLLNNVDILKDALGLVADETAYAGSVSREFQVRSETTANAIIMFKNKINELGITIGSILMPRLNQMLDVLGPIVTKITAFAEAHPELTSNVVAATTALIAFRVAVIGLKFAGLLGKGGALSLMAMGFGAIAKALGGISAVGNAVGLQTSLAGLAGIKVGGLEKIGIALRTIGMGIPGMAALGGILTAVGSALATISLPVWGAFALIAAAVGSAGLLVWKYWDRISSVFGGVAARIGEELAPALELARPAIDWLAGAGKVIGDGFGTAMTKLQEFASWIGSFFTQEVLTDEQKAAWGQTGYDLADSMINSVKAKIGELVEWFRGLPGMILGAVGNINLGAAITGTAITAPVQGNGGHTIYPVGQSPADLPAFATGGRVTRGMTALVGERGPEIVTFPGSGYVHPNGSMPRAPGLPSYGGGNGGGAGGNVVNNIGPIHLNNPTNADPATISRMLGEEIGRRMQTSFSDGAV